MPEEENNQKMQLLEFRYNCVRDDFPVALTGIMKDSPDKFVDLTTKEGSKFFFRFTENQLAMLTSLFLEELSKESKINVLNQYFRIDELERVFED
jgi:hypothetical protein